jgi:chromate transport protein ChrA
MGLLKWLGYGLALIGLIIAGAITSGIIYLLGMILPGILAVLFVIYMIKDYHDHQSKGP